MGFGKAFGAGIALFIGINVGLTFLVALLIGIDAGNMIEGVMNVLSAMSISIIYWIITLLSGMYLLFYSPPYVLINSISAGQLGDYASIINFAFLGENWFTALAFIIVLVMMFVVAIVVGYLSHSPGSGFGAMFLIVAIGAVLGVVGSLLYNSITYTAMGMTITLDLFTIIQSIILPIVVTTVINGLALGAIAMAMGYKFEE
ncbi:MAG: hypothetical protein EAX96_12330 [Candidatus Lokiarchaeota archaeon]|nr:hypothetical protein [Candidatus Lokiarchaeota archaeon]